MSTTGKRVSILISGRGSNMIALIRAARDSAFPAEIVGVISDKADAGGLKLAAAEGIANRAILRRDFASKDAHDAAIDAALVEMGAEIVCLAGYMRLLTAGFVQKWAGRMINIHPSLLPSFKGLDTHKRALDAGLLIHGCTVHYVTHDMDAGPIIAQAAVPVLPGDDADALSARVLKAEHQLYPQALRMVAAGDVAMQGERTVLLRSEAYAHDAQMLIAPLPLRQGNRSDEPVDLELLARSTP